MSEEPKIVTPEEEVIVNPEPEVVTEDKPVAEDQDDEAGEDGGDADEATAKKKRNKKKKKPAFVCRAVAPAPADYCPTTKDGRVQTSPPTIPVAEFFEDGIFPEGEIQQYAQDFVTSRVTKAEKKEVNKIHESEWNEIREAAEAHRRTRYDIEKFVRPGMSLMEISRRIEKSSRTMLGSQGYGDLIRGWGFPTGLSINHVAAHYSPNTGDTMVLGKDDVMKVDFGTQINGRIVDCAFTVHFNPIYDDLVEAVKEATNAGIKAAGVDMRLGDIGGIIQEVMESHECELNGKTYPVRCLRNLNGHSIGKYQIHGGKTVPIVNNGDQTKMEENELFAIETFGSINGRGAVYEDGEVSHLSLNPKFKGKIRGGDRPVKLYNAMQKNFSTLAFARKWLDDMGERNHGLALKQLVDQGVVVEHPPLVETKNAYTAQFEHTILLRPTCKEVVSRGYDY